MNRRSLLAFLGIAPLAIATGAESAVDGEYEMQCRTVYDDGFAMGVPFHTIDGERAFLLEQHERSQIRVKRDGEWGEWVDISLGQYKEVQFSIVVLRPVGIVKPHRRGERYIYV